MTTYPISVPPLKWYNGDDPKLLRRFENDQRMAERIERYINRKVETEHGGRASMMITFGGIGAALGVSAAKVQSYLYKFSGSSDNSILIEFPNAHAEENAA